ncbi:MAG: hypothetical protein HRU19_10465 [Pseudobacteriovorax sp.]|nr:hypothetical protein [Pseudobacteriovorax sp.]
MPLKSLPMSALLALLLAGVMMANWQCSQKSSKNESTDNSSYYPTSWSGESDYENSAATFTDIDDE